MSALHAIAPLLLAACLSAPIGAQGAAAAPTSEQRFRELQTQVTQSGGVTATTRENAKVLADLIDAEAAAPTTGGDRLQRILPMRAQLSIWIGDSAAMDAAFDRLLGVTSAPDAVRVAWARELVADGRPEKAIELLFKHSFGSTPAEIDGRIVLADALIAINRFEPAQAELNAAPAKGRTTAQQEKISLGTQRVGMARTLFNRELAALARDLSRGDLPRVEFTTTRGSVIIELFEDDAPNSVGNFIEHIESGTYNGTSFHRVLRGFGVQGGDPRTAPGASGARANGGWAIPDEHTNPNRRSPLPGRLVVARQLAGDSPVKPAAHSGGSQFMILTGPAEPLDGFYTVFGRVIDGMDVVGALREDDQIVQATVLSKRNHDYKGVRLGPGRDAVYNLPRPGLPFFPSQLSGS